MKGTMKKLSVGGFGGTVHECIMIHKMVNECFLCPFCGKKDQFCLSKQINLPLNDIFGGNPHCFAIFDVKSMKGHSEEKSSIQSGQMHGFSKGKVHKCEKSGKT